MSDYIPPGLGRTLEDLIAKHTPKQTKPETDYQWAVRNAAQTRAMLAAMSAGQPQPQPVEPVKPTPKPADVRKPVLGVKQMKRPHVNGKGRQAYEWAIANGKTAAEAARHFNVRPGIIYNHKRCYGTVDLSDGRYRNGSYQARRRDKALIRSQCAEVYQRMTAQKLKARDAVAGTPVTYQSFIRYCVRNKLAWKS